MADIRAAAQFLRNHAQALQAVIDLSNAVGDGEVIEARAAELDKLVAEKQADLTAAQTDLDATQGRIEKAGAALDDIKKRAHAASGAAKREADEVIAAAQRTADEIVAGANGRAAKIVADTREENRAADDKLSQTRISIAQLETRAAALKTDAEDFEARIAEARSILKKMAE